MTEVLQMQVENLNSDNQSISSSNGNSPAYEDLKVDTPDEDTRERSSSGEPIRERGSTITKKIPLSEYATLQGILAHQVDEGAACLKCGPEVCAGLDLHFWKKVCKNCGCPRGSHKIQKFIEEKKEVPKPILRQTADEDEEDYKEMEISAPPSKTTIKGKSDTHDSVKYNEEYISRLREFYSHKTAALNFPDYKKLSHEQQLMLQHYINQTQGQEVVSPEAVQSHLKLLAKTSSTGSDYHLDASEPEYRRSHSSEYRQSHSSASSDSSDQQFLQALQLLSFNKDQLRDLSPGVIPEYPDSTDDQLNEEEEVESLQDSLLHRQHNRQSPIQQPSQLPRQQDSQSPIQQDSQLPRQQPSQSPRHQDSQLPRKQGSQLAKKQRSPTDVSARHIDAATPNNIDTTLLPTDLLEDDLIDDDVIFASISSLRAVREESDPEMSSRISVLEKTDSETFSVISVDDRPGDTTAASSSALSSSSDSTEVESSYYSPGIAPLKGKHSRRYGASNANEGSTSTFDDSYSPSRSRSSHDRDIEVEAFRHKPLGSRRTSGLPSSLRSSSTGFPRSIRSSSTGLHSSSIRSGTSRSYKSEKLRSERSNPLSRVQSLPPKPIQTHGHWQRAPKHSRSAANLRNNYQETTSESSEEENVPAKPLRRHVGSFENMTQGDIADYYTHPSGDYASSASLPRTGSPGVWVPPGVDHHLVKQYLAALPEDKRPVNTLGVQWRIKQLQAQLPRYDHNINYCHEMTPEEQEELSMFVESRKENAQGQGEVKSFKKKSKKKCEKCGGVVDCAVLADKVPGRVWHPSCFSCHTCEEILVDLIYFQYDGRLYCGRHHAELLRPRCHACDELIFGHEFITADKHEYHKEHFCCWECDASLGGTKYVSHKGQPYCQGCFEKLFCMRCVTCREPIGVGVTVYRHGTLRWHGNSQCYACSFCKTSLVNRTFMPTEKYVYCSKNCYRCHESLKKTKGK